MKQKKVGGNERYGREFRIEQLSGLLNGWDEAQTTFCENFISFYTSTTFNITFKTFIGGNNFITIYGICIYLIDNLFTDKTIPYDCNKTLIHGITCPPFFSGI